MNRLDELIKEALGNEEAQIIGMVEEQGYFAQGLALFRGRNAWVIWVIMVAQTVMFIAGVWCAVRFFQAVDVLPALKWGISGAVLWIMAINLKLSLVPQMQADRVIREIKRAELLLLSNRADPSGD